MIQPAPAHPDRPRRRRLWTTAGIVGLAAVGATTLTTAAVFSDTDSTSADIRTGTVDLAVGTADFQVPAEGLAPGGSVFTPVTVTNAGSLELRYALQLSANPTT